MHGRPCEFRPEVRRRLARRAHRLSLRRRGPTVRASARQLPQGKVPGRSFELRNDRAHCGIGISARSHMAHSRVTWRTARSHMAHSRVTWRTQSDVAGGLPSATSSSTRQDGTRRATSGSTRHVRFDAPRQVRRASSGSTRQDGIDAPGRDLLGHSRRPPTSALRRSARTALPSPTLDATSLLPVPPVAAARDFALPILLVARSIERATRTSCSTKSVSAARSQELQQERTPARQHRQQQRTIRSTKARSAARSQEQQQEVRNCSKNAPQPDSTGSTKARSAARRHDPQHERTIRSKESATQQRRVPAACGPFPSGADASAVGWGRSPPGRPGRRSCGH